MESDNTIYDLNLVFLYGYETKELHPTSKSHLQYGICYGRESVEQIRMRWCLFGKTDKKKSITSHKYNPKKIGQKRKNGVPYV